MNHLLSYIPKDKHDLNPVVKLSEHEYPYYKEILPELFSWIQDMNWPVAKLIAPLLVKAGIDVIPHIRSIINSNDSMWKYWALVAVIDEMELSLKREVLLDLKDVLSVIINHPAPEDKADELDVIVKELFDESGISFKY